MALNPIENIFMTVNKKGNDFEIQISNEFINLKAMNFRKWELGNLRKTKLLLLSGAQREKPTD